MTARITPRARQLASAGREAPRTFTLWNAISRSAPKPIRIATTGKGPYCRVRAVATPAPNWTESATDIISSSGGTASRREPLDGAAGELTDTRRCREEAGVG